MNPVGGHKYKNDPGLLLTLTIFRCIAAYMQSAWALLTAVSRFGLVGNVGVLQELLAMQQNGPKNIGFFGTRNMGFMHQNLIEILSYAMVLTVRILQRVPVQHPPAHSGCILYVQSSDIRAKVTYSWGTGCVWALQYIYRRTPCIQ